MKYSKPIFYICLCLFFLGGNLSTVPGANPPADPPADPPVASPEAPADPPVASPEAPADPPVASPEAPGVILFNKSLDNTYKNYVARSNNFSNPEFYEKLKFRDKINNKIIEFSSMSDLDKAIFYILEGEKVSLELKKIEEAWRSIFLHVLKNPNKDIDIKILESYIVKIRELRKKHALVYEKFVEKTLKSNEDIPEEERKFLLKNIKKWHNKEKLINRNG